MEHGVEDAVVFIAWVTVGAEHVEVFAMLRVLHVWSLAPGVIAAWSGEKPAGVRPRAATQGRGKEVGIEAV